MRSISSRWFLLMGSLIVLGGCRNAEKQQNCCCEPPTADRVKPVAPPDLKPSTLPKVLPLIPTKGSDSIVPVLAPPGVGESSRNDTMKPVVTNTLPSPTPIKTSEVYIPIQVPVQVPAKPIVKPAPPKQEPTQVRDVKVEAKLTPVLGHAPNYRWLVGQLEQSESNHRWFIRYANSGERDTHGGRLELFCTGPMIGFHAGQVVRAEGELVDPAPLQTQSAYRIRSIQALKQ